MILLLKYCTGSHCEHTSPREKINPIMDNIWLAWHSEHGPRLAVFLTAQTEKASGTYQYISLNLEQLQLLSAI